MTTNCLIKSFLVAGLILPTAIAADIAVNGGFEATSTSPTNPDGTLYTASPWVITDPNIPAEASTGGALPRAATPHSVRTAAMRISMGVPG